MNKPLEYFVCRKIWWEDKNDDEGDCGDLNRWLNTMGSIGWDLIEVRPSQVKECGDLFIFKRDYLRS